MSLNEPKSGAAVKRWIEKHTRSSDRFAGVAGAEGPLRCHLFRYRSGGVAARLGSFRTAAPKRRITHFSQFVLGPVRAQHSRTRENGRISSADSRYRSVAHGIYG